MNNQHRDLASVAESAAKRKAPSLLRSQSVSLQKKPPLVIKNQTQTSRDAPSGLSRMARSFYRSISLESAAEKKPTLSPLPDEVSRRISFSNILTGPGTSNKKQNVSRATREATSSSLTSFDVTLYGHEIPHVRHQATDKTPSEIQAGFVRGDAALLRRDSLRSRQTRKTGSVGRRDSELSSLPEQDEDHKGDLSPKSAKSLSFDEIKHFSDEVANDRPDPGFSKAAKPSTASIVTSSNQSWFSKKNTTKIYVRRDPVVALMKQTKKHAEWSQNMGRF